MLSLCIIPNFMGTRKETIQAALMIIAMDAVIIWGCM